MSNIETTVSTASDSTSLDSEAIGTEQSDELTENINKSSANRTTEVTLKLPANETTTTTANTLPKIAPKPQGIKAAAVAGSKIVYIKNSNGTPQPIRIGGQLLGSTGTAAVVHNPNITTNAGAIQLIKTSDGNFLQIKNKNMISVQKPVTQNTVTSTTPTSSTNTRFVVKSGNGQRLVISTPSAATKSNKSPNATTSIPGNARTLTVSQAQQMGLISPAKLKELVSAAKTNSVSTTSTNSVSTTKQSLVLSSTVQSTSTPTSPTESTSSSTMKNQPTILNKGIKSVQQTQNSSQKVLIQTTNATSGTLGNNNNSTNNTVDSKSKTLPQNIVKMGQNTQIRAVNLGGKNLQYVRVLNTLPNSGTTSINNSTTVNSRASGITSNTSTTNGRPVYVQRKILPQQQVTQQKDGQGQFITKKLEVTPIAVSEGSSNNRAIKKEVSNVTQSNPKTFLLNNTQKSVMNTPIDVKPILNNQESYEITTAFKSSLSTGNVPQKVIYRTYKLSEDQKPKSPTDSQQAQTHYSNLKFPSPEPLDGIRRKHCNCTKSQCLKLYCDCFASGEYCSNCNCKECSNTLEKEVERQKAIKMCLERNSYAFKPKIGKARDESNTLRRHTKGCNCKRSGCLKNYCECYEAKIVCSANCKCIGCRNLDDAFDHNNERDDCHSILKRTNDQRDDSTSNILSENPDKKSCNFITPDVIEATIQCVIAQADDCLKNEYDIKTSERKILEEFGRCLVEIIDFSQKNSEDGIEIDE